MDKLDIFDETVCNLRKTSSSQSYKIKTAKEQLDSSGTDTDDAVVIAASHGTVKNVQMGNWLIDSHATSRMTNQMAILKHYKEFKQGKLDWVMDEPFLR